MPFVKSELEVEPTTLATEPVALQSLSSFHLPSIQRLSFTRPGKEYQECRKS